MRIGSYSIVRELARGAMGVVYLAKHDELDREVALKVMQLASGKAPDRKLVKRFELEARTVAQLNHPNIVRVHEVGTEGDKPFLVMDLIEGESLHARMKREGPLPCQEAASLTQALAEALEHAHQRSILHRDLKPANVLLSADGTPHVTDFGLARDESEDDRLTRQGQWLGTPGFMPPEQARGQLDRVDRRADVYGLGATLFAMLTGNPPFEADNEMNTIKALIEQPPPAPSAARKEVDAELEAICLKCLEKEPEARYPTAQDLAEDLGRYLRDEPVEARPPQLGDRLRKWLRRNKPLAAAAVVALLLLGGVGGGAYAFVILPEQRAQAYLSEHEVWEREVLAPFALGVAPGAALPTGEDLAGRLSKLEEAVERVGAGKHTQALALLKATIRAQAFRKTGSGDVPRAGSKRGAPDLVVDALILRERGDRREARRRVEQALKRQAAFLPAKLLELVLLAEDAPGDFLVRASSGQVEGQLLRELAPRAVVSLYRSAFLRAATSSAPLSRTDLRKLAEARERSAALGISTRDVLSAKVEALESAAEAWGKTLAAAIERKREVDVLRRLSALVQSRPPVRPGPKLAGVLDSTLAQLLDLERSAVDRRNSNAAYERVRRVSLAEHVMFYGIDPRRRHIPRMRAVLLSSRTVQMTSNLEPELALACVRYGVFLNLGIIDRLTSRPRIDKALEPYPTSRFRRARVWQARMRGRRGSDLDARVEELSELLSAGLDDLSPRYWFQLLGEAVEAARKTHQAKRVQLGQRLRNQAIACRKALTSVPGFERYSLLECLRLEADAAGLAWGKHARLRSFMEGAAVLRARVGKAGARSRGVDRDVLARFLLRFARVRAQEYWELEPAVKLCVEALSHWQRTPGFVDRMYDGKDSCVIYLSGLLRRLRRPAEAAKVLKRHGDVASSEEARFLEEKAYVCWELGQKKEAKEILRKGIRAMRRPTRRAILERALETLEERDDDG